MSVIRQSSQQVRSTLESLPLQSRVVLLVIGAAMIAGLYFWAQLPQGLSTTPLFGGRTLNDHELDLAEISFSKAGLTRWQRVDGKLIVPKDERHEYLAALENSTALPATLRSSVQQAIDQTNILESDSVRRARQEHAKSVDLGNQLASFDDVSWARVVHDTERTGSFGGEIKQSAAVVVCPVGDAPLPPARVRTIQEFIRGAYAGMSPDDVVVIDKNATDTYCGHDDDPATRIRLTEQARIKHELTRLLKDYGPMQLSVSVQTNRDNLGTNAPAIADQATPGQATATPPNVASSSGRDRAEPSDSDLLSSLFVAVTRVRGNRSARIDSSDQENQQNTRVVGGNDLSSQKSESEPIVESVHVAVGLPYSFFVQQWRMTFGSGESMDSNPEAKLLPSTQQLEQVKIQTRENLRQAITPVLLASNRPSARATVDVWTIPQTETPSPVAQTQATGWANWRAPIGKLLSELPPWMAGVGGAILLAIFLTGRALRRRFRVERLDTSVPDITGSSPSESQDGTLKSELVTLVDANPELAADIIHDWVTEAA